MRARYGPRMDYLARIYDSPGWKRICSTHTLCMQLTTGHPSPFWRSSPTGQFSLKYAYEDIRPHHAQLFSHKFIWWKGIQKTICLFIWKLLHSALPMEDNVKAFSCVCPTICPFCKNASASISHIFLLCPRVQPLWSQLSVLLDGPMIQAANIRQHLLQWWLLSSATSLKGNFKVVGPIMLCWAIWRVYTNHLFGEEDMPVTHILHLTKQSCFDWAASRSGTAIAQYIPSLINNGFSPRLRPKRVLPLKWTCPPTGKLKLNVDASAGHSHAAAGAILRDANSKMIVGLSFRLPILPPLRAELQAIVYSLLYFGLLHRNIIIETDCQQLTQSLDNRITALPEHNRLLQLLRLTGSTLHHIPREINMVAHYLCLHARFQPLTCLFTSASQLPQMARAFYHTDGYIHAIRM